MQSTRYCICSDWLFGCSSLFLHTFICLLTSLFQSACLFDCRSVQLPVKSYIYNYLPADCLLRLSGGEYAWEGLLEINVNGEWGGVCHNGWDAADSKVACKQLGYSTVLQISTHRKKMTDSYLIDNSTCTGNETSLCSCPSVSFGPDTSCESNFSSIALTCACK